MQRRALASWVHVVGPEHVYVVGDDEGVAEVAADLGVHHVPRVPRSPSGRPLLHAAFERVLAKTDDRFACYVNGDVIIFPDVLKGVDACGVALNQFLMVSRRVEVSLPHDLSHGAGLLEDVRRMAEREGLLAPPLAIDLFAFPTSWWRGMPPFAVGVPGWDNWMIYAARHRGTPVVDATPDVTVVHQDLEAGYARGKSAHFTGPDGERHAALVGGAVTFDIADATHELRDGRLRPRRRSVSERSLKHALLTQPFLRRFVYPAVAWRVPEPVKPS